MKSTTTLSANAKSLQVIHHHYSSPPPPKPKVPSLNDYRPVALTSITMKVFERLVLRYLKTATDSLLDPHQFAYRANRSVEDAACLGLHHVLKHLDCPNICARILSIDYSLAFSTIILHKFFNKLRLLNVNTQMCKWISDFLRFSSQPDSGSQIQTSAIRTPDAKYWCTSRVCTFSPTVHTLHQCLQIQ